MTGTMTWGATCVQHVSDYTVLPVFVAEYMGSITGHEYYRI